MSEENKYILQVKDLHTSFATDAGEVSIRSVFPLYKIPAFLSAYSNDPSKLFLSHITWHSCDFLWLSRQPPVYFP